MTKQILAFLFCFTRELNPYSPLTSFLTRRARTQTLTLTLRPPIRPYFKKFIFKKIFSNVLYKYKCLKPRLYKTFGFNPHPPPTHPSIPPTTYKQVVKQLKEKPLYYYIQECLSVRNVIMILYPC